MYKSAHLSNAYWIFDSYYKGILCELYGPMEPKLLFVKAYHDGLTESRHSWIMSYL